MKVDFKNCTFANYPTSFNIEFEGKDYRCLKIEVVLDDGRIDEATVAPISLGDSLCDKENLEPKSAQAEDIDNTISFYAEDDDDMYEVLESIFGENIVNK